MRNHLIVGAWVCAVCAVMGLASTVHAITLLDDATDSSAYADGWDDGDNGGGGFGAWNLSGTYWDAASSPYASSHTIDDGSSAFNNLGTAFTLTNSNNSSGGTYASFAKRPLTAPLGVGDTFSIDIDNPQYAPINFDGTGFDIALRNAANKNMFVLGAYYSSPQWQYYNYDINAFTDTGLSVTAGAQGFNFAITLLAGNQFDLVLTPFGPGQPIEITGSLGSPADPQITKLRIQLYGNGSGDGATEPTGERELFFTNMAIIPVPLLGDLDGDGDVDIADLQTFAGNFGGVGDLASGDFDGDGQVTIADLQILADNFGTSPGSPSAALADLGHADQLATATIAVPEPASLTLIGLGGVLMLRRQR